MSNGRNMFSGRFNWVLLCVFLVFMLVALVLFADGLLSSKTIQGVDGSLSVRSAIACYMDEGIHGWWRPFWLGSASSFGLKTHLFFMRMLPAEEAMFGSFIFTILLAQFFMFLFLRDLKLSVLPVLMGAIGYGLAPHYLTLIFPMHIGSVSLMAYVPALFFFLRRSFKCPGGIMSWTYPVMAGVAWGMVMNEDVQRGLYVSVAAAAYVVFAYFSWIDSTRQAGESVRRILRWLSKATVVGLVFIGVFFSNFASELGGPRMRGKISGVDGGGGRAKEEKWAFATSWSLNPKELIDSVAPGYHGLISGDRERPYWGSRPVAHSSDSLGFFVLLFGIAGALAAFRKSGDARFFTLAAILATLLAFGRYWPGKPLFWLWHQLPVMDRMRAPVKFMCVTSFSLSVLSAYGLNDLQQRISDKDERGLMGWTLGAGVVLLLALLALFGVMGAGGTLRELITTRVGVPQLVEAAMGNIWWAVLWMLVLSAISLVLILVSRKFKTKSWVASFVGGAFILLMAVELLSLNRFYVKRTYINPNDFYRKDEVLGFLESNSEQHRAVLSLKVIHNGRMVPLPLAANANVYTSHMFPYHGIEALESPPQSRVPKDYNAFFGEILDRLPQTRDPNEFLDRLVSSQVRLWRLTSVKYVITDGYLYGLSNRPMPILESLERNTLLKHSFTGYGRGNRQYHIFEVTDVLPRFSVVTDIQRVADENEALKLIGSDAFEPVSSVVVSDGVKEFGSGIADRNSGVALTESLSTRIKMKVYSPAGGVLVRTDRIDEAWQVYVDGKKSVPVSANYIMTGVPLQPGEHEVEFVFALANKSVAVSVGVMIAALLGAFATWLWGQAALSHAKT